MLKRFAGFVCMFALCCVLALTFLCPSAYASVIVTEAPGTIVEENGTLYYYENGERCGGKGLIYLDGYFYYVRTNGDLAVDREYWCATTNGLVEANTYTFDSCGRMVDPPEYEVVSPDPDPNPEPDPEPEPEPNKFTLGVFMSDVNTVFTKGMGMVGSVVETVVSYPILYLSIVIGLCGIGVALFNCLKQ